MLFFFTALSLYIGFITLRLEWLPEKAKTTGVPYFKVSLLSWATSTLNYLL